MLLMCVLYDFMLYTSILCKYIALKKINKYNKNRAIPLILFFNAEKNIFLIKTIYYY